MRDWNGLEWLIGLLSSFPRAERIKRILTPGSSSCVLRGCHVVTVTSLTALFYINDWLVSVLRFTGNFAFDVATSVSFLRSWGAMSHVESINCFEGVCFAQLGWCFGHSLRSFALILHCNYLVCFSLDRDWHRVFVMIETVTISFRRILWLL